MPFGGNFSCAAECTMVVVTASCASSGGKIPGSRLASIDLPAESGRHLIGAYKALAEEPQRQGDYAGAISYYEHSLEVAAKLVCWLVLLTC